MDPIELFNSWYAEQVKSSTQKIPAACCLSTIGLDDFPNARFVALKEVVENAFIVTGVLNSRKGAEINNSNKIALTFWWTETERQIRIQGEAFQISKELADHYFNKKDRDAQLVSMISEQGKAIPNIETLNQKYLEAEKEFLNKKIERPDYWSGILIKPIRIEFFEFKSSRFHERKLFELKNENWTMQYIQP